MTRFDKISDEKLAAYLEGMLSANDAARVETNMDMDTFEILNVSRNAMRKFPADDVISLPSWDDVTDVPVHSMYEPLAMAGFLGENHADEETDIDDE